MAGIILAGGMSRRLKRNKALLPYGRKVLIEGIRDVLAGLFTEVLVVTNTPAVYHFLDVPAVEDRIKGKGPLGGIHAGLSACRAPCAFVVACDMPFVNPDLVRYMAGLRERGEAPPAVVVPFVAGEYEPMHALYDRQCLPFIEQRLRGGERRIISFYPDVTVKTVTEEEIRHFGSPEILFYNINTPDDLAGALALQGKGFCPWEA